MAAVAIHPRSLRVEEDNVFNSFIKPYFTDEECQKNEVDPLTDGARRVHKIPDEDLIGAPSMPIVLKNLENWLKPYSQGHRAIRIGYNNHLFDDIILDRYCQANGLWKPARKENKLFYKRSLDLMEILFHWIESLELEGNSFDDIRQWLGISKEGGHRAGKDVIDGARVFVRFQKFMRNHALKTQFAGTFKE